MLTKEKYLVEYTVHSIISKTEKHQQEMTRKELIDLLNKGNVTVWEVKYKLKGGL